MKRCTCGDEMVRVQWEYHVQSRLIGEIVLSNIEQDRCVKCNKSRISLEVARRIEEEVKQQEAKAVGKLQIEDFISGRDAAKILGVTKQAFSKNPRIQNGFIISRRIDDRFYYYEPSVRAFESSKDGRLFIGLRDVSAIATEPVATFEESATASLIESGYTNNSSVEDTNVWG